MTKDSTNGSTAKTTVSRRADAGPLIIAIVIGLCVALSLTIAAAWASDPERFSIDRPSAPASVLSIPPENSEIVSGKLQDRHPAFEDIQTP
ncbi:hypothetical protein JM93_01009 [Roseibium hamelinense]|uniref:Uncharacterized protein n=1 Tax=Roseibium hamelinense TaxID=150831 RepID=A0A562T9R8_9HYPH|nr:hypothetical protein [Roseibium hamelinense]MTI45589.1 hypothetical protein [Roseibium hamelinense]TWI90033.1 hypothetical protein JM93_01009 [Roseibium hamelinense]